MEQIYELKFELIASDQIGIQIPIIGRSKVVNFDLKFQLLEHLGAKY